MTVQYQPTGGTAAAISASVESGIRGGQLGPGASLPPVRGLAGTLGVSPATVAAAYRMLRERGLVETAGRSGTRVRARPPIARRTLHAPPAGLDLASGMPDPALLPSLRPHLARLAATVEPITYSGGGALPELLDLAAERFAADGIPPGRLAVTGGALDGIERVLGAHLRPGDRIAVEDPGWANLLDLVAALGLTPVPMPVDAEGPTVEGMRAVLASGVAGVVVTSRAQNPTGAILSAGRAGALRGLLRQYPKNLVLEDDHAAELAHRPAHPLVGVTESWAYIRSLSKPYGPDLRAAVLVGDEATTARLEGRMRLGVGWVSTLLQRLVIALWLDPAVDAMVRLAGERYASRREALRAALGELTSHGSSGFNVWVPVPDETSAVAGLREDGFAVAPGALYRLASPPAIRITAAALDERDAPRVAEAVLRRIAGGGHRSV